PKDFERTGYPIRTLAAGCFHLAGKTEEDLLKIRDIINVFHVMIHDDKIMDIDENYWEIREGLGKIEMLILRVLKFRVWRELPH
uniref:Uncharacterized protein n=1 Tax=Romanomermis culicivorax TaxID=13658 RepID=A0A915IE94_ROMCU